MIRDCRVKSKPIIQMRKFEYSKYVTRTLKLYLDNNVAASYKVTPLDCGPGALSSSEIAPRVIRGTREGRAELNNAVMEDLK